MQYISFNLYRKMIHHAMYEDMASADFDDLLIPISAMNDIRAVPADNFFELHERLDKTLGPGFSARIGQQMKMDDYGVLGLSWKTCSTAGEIFERSERNFHLLSNTYVFKVEKDGEFSNIHLFRDAHRRGVELSNVPTFSAIIVVLQAMTETNKAPIHVSFTHGPPTNLENYLDAFNCPIQFNQTNNTLTYKTTDLETRTAKADSSINKFLLERVEKERKGEEVSSIKIASDVESQIKHALPSGIPSNVLIGKQMGMSSGTLSQRLTAHGITFRDLVKRTQEKISKDLLQNTTLTISEIAFQAGFSEQSAFSRAFKRWTGQSPQEYRNPH